MSRAKRNWYPGATYHVMSRGNRRLTLYKDEDDFLSFLESVSRAKELLPFKIHSLCLLTNHFHMSIETEDKELWRIMQRILHPYAMNFNRKYHFTGHLFEDRYTAQLIEDERYFLEVSRYIHLNPVKAHMVREPLGYEYSSYSKFLSVNENNRVNRKSKCTKLIDELTDTSRVLSCFRSNSREKYRMFVEGKISHAEQRIETFVSQRVDDALKYRAEEILKSSRLEGIDIIVRDDILYPDRFRDIADIPILVYCKGKLRINEFNDTIGIVGARRCTREGKKKAIDVATRAVGDNMAVISGLVKGIDSYAHTAALKSEGYTIAVLGNGADICYPKEHDRLYEGIVRRGCILSEYPPGTGPRAYCFPRRNRLIAALSDKLYVVDAGRHSGTESTVENAGKYGREVININFYNPCSGNYVNQRNTQ